MYFARATKTCLAKCLSYGNFLVTLKRYKVILKAIKNDSKLKMKRIKGRRWENAKLKFKRYRIPIEILTDNKLSDKEKIIYTITIYLSKENQYCYLTNKSISELLNISITQVSKLVNSLKDKGYINSEIIYKENSKEVKMRKIIPIEEKLNTLSNKTSIPYPRKV